MSTDQPSPESPNATPPDAVAEHAAILRSAMKAFKKRMKATRLDDESRLGHGPMSKGGRSGIVAITPPTQFPPAIWDELAQNGKLRRAGGGMYEIVSED